MISYNNDINSLESVCNDVYRCASLIKVCDSLVKDHRGGPKGNRATIVQARAVLGIKYPGNPPNGWKGSILPNGDVKIDFVVRGKPDTRIMPRHEVDRLVATGLYSSGKGQFGNEGYSYSPYSGGYGFSPSYSAPPSNTGNNQQQQQPAIPIGQTIAELGKATIAIAGAITAIETISRVLSNSKLGAVASKLKTTVGDLKRESINVARMKR